MCLGVLSKRGVEGEDEVVFESELSVRSGNELRVNDSFEVEDIGDTERLLGEAPKDSRKRLCSVVIDLLESVREGELNIFGDRGLEIRNFSCRPFGLASDDLNISFVISRTGVFGLLVSVSMLISRFLIPRR